MSLLAFTARCLTDPNTLVLANVSVGNVVWWIRGYLSGSRRQLTALVRGLEWIHVSQKR